MSVPQQADAVPSCLDGGGIDGDPFLVATEADLRKVGSGVDGCTLGAHYRQTQDIMLTGPFTSIGRPPDNPFTSTSFTGVYDGGEKSISGMEIVEAASSRVGFVARTSIGAKLENIVLVGPKVYGDEFVGGLVGQNAGEIRNVIVTSGLIEASDGVVGGLVGVNGGEIGNAHFSGAVVSGNDRTYSGAGGLVGINDGFTTDPVITDSSASGSVTADGNFVGGLVGDFQGEITNSFASVTVQGDEYVGGLVGFNDGVIMRSFASGTVQGSEYVGGLIAYNSGSGVPPVE